MARIFMVFPCFSFFLHLNAPVFEAMTLASTPGIDFAQKEDQPRQARHA